MYDLFIKNGNVFHSKEDFFIQNLGIKDGKIEYLGNEEFESKETIDADGKYLVPGAIDPHTHFGIYNSWDKDFYTESRAAATGGITTIINFFRGKESYFETLPNLLKSAEENSIIDFSIHLGILTENHLEEINKYIEEFGISSYKIYTNYMGKVNDIFGTKDGLNLDDGDLDYLFRKIGKKNLNARIAVHCENMEISRRLSKIYLNQEEPTLEFHNKLSPDYAETESVISTLYLAKSAGARVYIVHVSSGSTIEALVNNPNLLENDSVIETCPHYLIQNINSEAGLKAKVNPPVRTKEDNDLIWEGIRNGIVTTIGSDHCNLDLGKKGTGQYMNYKPGFSSLSLTYPILLDEGYHKRNIDLSKIVKLTSENVARAYNLYPQKGSLKKGTDADICIIDLEKEKEVTYLDLNSSSDFSIYEGRKFKGWPIYTISRGNIIMKDGKILNNFIKGNFLKR